MKVLNEEMAKDLKQSGALENFLADGNVYITEKAKEFLQSGGEKPEYLTSLYGTRMVIKNNPRIVFRGKMDSFQAKVLELQLLAREQGDSELMERLSEVLSYCRKILAAEVCQKPLEGLKLFGMGEKELRSVSQHPQEHFGVEHLAPDIGMGATCVLLNSLRAQSREVELAAVTAFYKTPKSERLDLLQAMNRLSSGIYILFCERLAKQQREGNRNE